MPGYGINYLVVLDNGSHVIVTVWAYNTYVASDQLQTIIPALVKTHHPDRKPARYLEVERDSTDSPHLIEIEPGTWIDAGEHTHLAIEEPFTVSLEKAPSRERIIVQFTSKESWMLHDESGYRALLPHCESCVALTVFNIDVQDPPQIIEREFSPE